MLELLEREKGHHDSPLTVEQNGISVAFVDFWYIERERERETTLVKTGRQGSQAWAKKARSWLYGRRNLEQVSIETLCIFKLG